MGGDPFSQDNPPVYFFAKWLNNIENFEGLFWANRRLLPTSIDYRRGDDAER